MNNLWILKPWNMARTIDTSITDNLSAIIRMMETGPKICQKYIEHPALFKGKKFDLRYVVLVRSIDPLEIYLTEIFWVMLILILHHSQYKCDYLLILDKQHMCQSFLFDFRLGCLTIHIHWKSTVSLNMKLTSLSWYFLRTLFPLYDSVLIKIATSFITTTHVFLFPCLFSYAFQNYGRKLNHKPTAEFVREFEQEHNGIHYIWVSFLNIYIFEHFVFLSITQFNCQ